jgi:drug/metabolite transporter (DMT)-like permease
MIWAVIAGLLVFGDAPDGVTLFGIGVIALSGVVVAFSGRSKKNS